MSRSQARTPVELSCPAALPSSLSIRRGKRRFKDRYSAGKELKMLRAAGKRLAPLPWRPTCAGFSLFSRDPTYAAPSDHDSMSGTSTLTTRLALESGLVGRIRGFSSESLDPRHHDLGLADLPATMAAMKNPNLEDHL